MVDTLLLANARECFANGQRAELRVADGNGVLIISY